MPRSGVGRCASAVGCVHGCVFFSVFSFQVCRALKGIFPLKPRTVACGAGGGGEFLCTFYVCEYVNEKSILYLL